MNFVQASVKKKTWDGLCLFILALISQTEVSPLQAAVAEIAE